MTTADGWTLAVAIIAALISIWAIFEAKLAPRRERQQALRDQLRAPLEGARDHLAEVGEGLRLGRSVPISRELLTNSAHQIEHTIPRLKAQPHIAHETASTASSLEHVSVAFRDFRFHDDQLGAHRANLEADRTNGAQASSIVASQRVIDDLMLGRDAARTNLAASVERARVKIEAQIARLDEADRK